MKKMLLLCLLMSFMTSINAQRLLIDIHKKEIQVINRHVEELNYEAVIKELRKIDSISPNNANINYNIGKYYLLMPSNKTLAIGYLDKALKNVSPDYKGLGMDDYAPIDVYYELGKAYHLNYEFDKAIENFQKYKTLYRAADQFVITEIDRHIQMCYVAKKLKANPVNIKIENLGSNINTQFPEYCPVVTQDESSIIFTSRRRGSTGNLLDEQGKFYEDIFVANRNIKGEWMPPAKIGSNINTMGHEAAISLSYDGLQLFIYKDDEDDGNIYVSNFEDYQWSAPIKLNANVNSKYWETHAALSPNGKTLYFTSNRPGGFGGRDIYKSMKNGNGEWGPAINLGPTINTPYNEESPFILSDGKTMYFSSEGHESMGGFDIFVTTLTDDDFWTTPINVGYPINTTENDVFFVPSSDKKHAYYSSANEQGYGDQDIYMITILHDKDDYAVLHGYVTDPYTYKPVEAKIEVTDKAKALVVANTMSSKITGEYAITLPTENDYTLKIEADKYKTHTEDISIGRNKKNVEITRDVSLESKAGFCSLNSSDYCVGDKFILKNVYFDTDKIDLRRESIEELQRLIKFLTAIPSIKIELSGHTDNVGKADHNKELSQNRAKAVMEYLVQNGINANRLTYAGYGFEQPIATNLTEEGKQKNRRTEIKILEK